MKKIILVSLCLFSTFSLPAEECVCSPEMTSKAFTGVAKKSIPAVVFIKTETRSAEFESFNDPYGDEFFERFFGGPQGRPQQQPQMSQGSGFVISSEGFIMTNAHVVKGAEKIEVVMHNGEVLTATLVGSDPHTDIAIVKVDGKDLPYLKLGDSEALDIGEWVVAIGSPFQLESSLTVGVVSAKGRQNLRISDLEDFIQTDAAINPGNSGGPLLNLKSEVIGINTAIYSRTGGYMGLGFAVPSNMAKHVMDQIINKGSVTRGFLGVTLQPVDKEIAAGFNLEKTEGVLVSDVVKDSPADKAGLKQGDIILEYNGKPVKAYQTFRNDIALMSPDTKVALKVFRKGKMVDITVILGAASDSSTNPGAVSQKLGIDVESLSPDLAKQLGYTHGEEGIVITKVKPGSPGAMAGLRPGFLIMGINHKKITCIADYEAAMSDSTKNKRLLLLVRQGNITKFYSIRME